MKKDPIAKDPKSIKTLQLKGKRGGKEEKGEEAVAARKSERKRD